MYYPERIQRALLTPKPTGNQPRQGHGTRHYLTDLKTECPLLASFICTYLWEFLGYLSTNAAQYTVISRCNGMRFLVEIKQQDSYYSEKTVALCESPTLNEEMVYIRRRMKGSATLVTFIVTSSEFENKTTRLDWDTDVMLHEYTDTVCYCWFMYGGKHGAADLTNLLSGFSRRKRKRLIRACSLFMSDKNPTTFLASWKLFNKCLQVRFGTSWYLNIDTQDERTLHIEPRVARRSASAPVA